MRMITLDFETYYSKDFSLSKMTTEAYIRDKEFQVIGFGYKIDDQEAQWVTGTNTEIEMALASLDIEDSYLIAHNMAFDGAILAWRYGIRPKFYIDTLSMARPITGGTVGGSLAKLAQKFALGAKGTEVVNAIGLRREDFSPQQLAAYGEYCINDVQICWNLYHILKQWNPPKELFIQDLMVRMFTDPVLELDTLLLGDHLNAVQNKKAQLMDRIDSTIGRDALMSNPKFAEVLIKLGVTPPMKTSLRTEKETYAFGKTDPGFKALLEHPDTRVQAVVAARLGIKSTLEETRTENFIGISSRGTLPILLNYWGAHTGRASGGDKMNLQNLPRGGALRRSIKAPTGHKLVVCDSSQIEARVVAWLSSQEDLVKAFARGEDIYSMFASNVYGKTVTKADKVERFVGKTCLAEGTLVLCDSGWKTIETVTTDDKLWDGEEWVCHQGLVNNGIRPTLNLSGLWLTPDHQVWSGTQWLEAQSLVQDASTHSLALGTAAENLPLQATYGVRGEGLLHLSSDAIAGLKSTELTTITSKTLKALGVTFVPKLRPAKNGTGCIQTQWVTTRTALDCSIDWHRPLRAAIPPQVKPTHIMEGEVSQYSLSGEKTERHFYGMFKRLRAGITQALRWTELMSTAITNRTTFVLYQEATTSKINAELLTSRQNLQVYDLACAGPRHRFTVLTEDGPLIVHNCILGLGYGMGSEKFKATLKAGAGGISVDMPEDEAKRTVTLYRNTYNRIAQLWNSGNEALHKMSNGFETEFGGPINLLCDGEGVHLPNGTMIRYANLRRETDGNYVYDGRYGPVKIYGGKFVENVVQALARIVVFNQMAQIEQILRPMDTSEERHRVVLTVHDEVVCVVPEHRAEWTLSMMMEQMSRPPKWASLLPVTCEGDIGDTYGDAK